MRSLVFLIPVALLACSPPPPPAAPPEAAPAAPAPSAPASVDPGPAAPPPSAHVVEIAPATKEGAAGARAKILFENPGKGGCRVLGYKLSWAGRSKAITLQDLTIPPGETRERWLKLSPDDGDLGALTPASGQVELKVDCSR